MIYKDLLASNVEKSFEAFVEATEKEESEGLCRGRDYVKFADIKFERKQSRSREEKSQVTGTLVILLVNDN